MSESDKLELIGQIIDIFEDYLDTVSYTDKCLHMNDDGSEEKTWMDFVEKVSEAPWFADEDYFDIENRIEETLKNWGVFL